MAATNPVFSISSENIKTTNGDVEKKGSATSGQISGGISTSSKYTPFFNNSDSALTLVTNGENLSSSDLSSKPSTVSIPEKHSEHREDTTIALVAQIVAALIVAGIGTVGAGLLLDTVQEWTVYQNVSEMFIMVPPLLGLKGNLEMTLASRLSTLAHLGVLNDPKERWLNFGSNLALTQTQAITFACLAALVAVFLGGIRTRELRFGNFLLLCSAGMVAASGAALFLGILMVSVILAARHCKINPDNIATPLAASFGDLLTVSRKNDYQKILHRSLI